jgi:hypothetical protein
MDDLIEVITGTIFPTTWDCVGGPGSIAPAGGMLVISQTQEVHRQIEELLGKLRAASPGLRVVTVRAAWLSLDQKQLNELMHSKAGSDGGINRKALEEMATKVKGYLGAISCLSGQTVHIASGRSRSAVVGAIPVVGSGAAYQPIVVSPQMGAVLQVTPQLLPDTQAALLDLCSVVTRPDGPPESTRFLADKSPDAEKEADAKSSPVCASTTINLDRVKLVAEQLATTLKVPLGEPTLVGGLTREPSADNDAAATPQLYLFIEATAK